MPLRFALSVTTGVVEVLLYGGLIFGWNSLSYILRKENFFTASCSTDSNIIDNNNSSTEAICVGQEESMVGVYTAAIFALNFCSLPIGASLDRLGIFITRSGGAIIVTLGVVLLIVATPDTSVLVYPAVCCIAVGGICVLMVNLPASNLYPKARSTIICIMNGAFDSSAAIPLLVKVAYDNGIALKTSCTFIAITTVIIWLRSLFLMPFKSFPYQIPDDFQTRSH